MAGLGDVGQAGVIGGGYAPSSRVSLGSTISSSSSSSSSSSAGASSEDSSVFSSVEVSVSYYPVSIFLPGRFAQSTHHHPPSPIPSTSTTAPLSSSPLSFPIPSPLTTPSLRNPRSPHKRKQASTYLLLLRRRLSLYSAPRRSRLHKVPESHYARFIADYALLPLFRSGVCKTLRIEREGARNDAVRATRGKQKLGWVRLSCVRCDWLCVT